MLKAKGFTLIELIVVIVILGVLSSLAIPTYLSFIQNGESQAAQNNLVVLYAAEKAYYLNHGTYCINSGDSKYCGNNSNDLNYNLKSNIVDSTYTYSCSSGSTSYGPLCCTATNAALQVISATPAMLGGCTPTCTPSCLGVPCGGSNGCAGVCPTGACANGYDCSVGQCFKCSGTCSDGQCHDTAYIFCGINCPATCSLPNSCNGTNQCTQCIKHCQTCSATTYSDGCGGTCPANCASPSICNAQNQCIYCSPSCIQPCSTSTYSDGCGGTCPANCTAPDY